MSDYVIKSRLPFVSESLDDYLVGIELDPDTGISVNISDLRDDAFRFTSRENAIDVVKALNTAGGGGYRLVKLTRASSSK